MTGIEYFFSRMEGIFLPLGRSILDKNALLKVEKILNSKERKYPIPLWGNTMFLAKRVMPKRAENKEDATPGRIKFLVAPLLITRGKKGKIKLAVKEKDFQPPIEEEFRPFDEHVEGLDLAAGTQSA